MSKKALLGQYLGEIAAIAVKGDAREESFYGALSGMLAGVAEAEGRDYAHITTLPAKTEGGNPDFRIWNGSDRVIGYIEAKKPTEEDLSRVEDSPQLRRYRATFPNLILTNFLEFRLYRNGERVESVTVARPHVLNQLRATPPAEKPDELLELLGRFMDFSLPSATTAEELAVQLARRTRFLRDMVAEQLAEEQAGNPGTLTAFYEAFREFLIGDLTTESFADLYAQTITYGLFAARARSNGGFSRRAAFDLIPHSIGVLRDLFRFVSLGDPPTQIEWPVDDIAGALAAADAPGILDRYYREGKGSDPIVHFYETFLAQYDPAERERRGVYYTPEPVVSYIVRSLHHLLKTEFGKTDGLASDGVTLLDPAAGTMTFVARAAQEAVREFESKYGAGGREDFIRRHILNSFYAFELMMAPYAVGHLKMSFFLEELGHRLANDERVPLFLTNSLDMEELEQSRLPGLSSLAEESRLAGKVKRETPILVILGNPPYSGHSSNMGDWIRGLVETYKIVDGKPLAERNPKWLQDDYVKFLRFAQWKIEQAGRGVVGMITNHSYLDNPTFRGMRQSLMRTFDDIYVLDLHGNSLKRETCPDGSKDENVFDIRQGVAIVFLVKRGGASESETRVRHVDLYGLRDRKYSWLHEHDKTDTGWADLLPKSPSYFFIQRDETLEASYRQFVSIPDLFPVNSIGVVTARDNLAIQWSSEELWKTITVFSRMEPEVARQAYDQGKDTLDRSVVSAQQDITSSGPSRENVVPILYRPFDVRYTYYTGRSGGFIGRPRAEVMRHMLQENISLITPRRVEHVGTWQHALVWPGITEHVAVSLKTGDYQFPLYVYPNGDRDLFSRLETGLRTPNLNPQITAALAQAYGKEPTPEDVFHYVYGVLYTPAYREKYAEFLRMDFPRVPFMADAGVFTKVGELGRRLVDLHLLRSPELDPPIAKFEGKGAGRIARGLRYKSDEQRVYVNETQYFGPVPHEVWSYRIGGYQVCDKWLKDRRERILDINGIRTYCRIITALKLTMEVQADLDCVYPLIEENVIANLMPER